MPNTVCRNCGTPLQGRYCHQCGQEEFPGFPSIGRLLSDFTVSLFEADSRLWRTLAALLLRPGFLTAEFFAGRRERYIPPFRLYLVTSLLFFLLLSLTTDLSSLTPIDGADPSPVSAVPEKSLELPPEGEERFDLEGRIYCDPEYSGPFSELATPRIIAACEQFQRDGGYALAQRFMNNLPTAMFFLMPLFAGFMRLFYWRPRRYFTEHLVFQVHNHSAFFIVAMLSQASAALLPPALDGGLDMPFIVYSVWYCYRSLRRYYGQGRRTTLFKFFTLGYIYLILALVTALLTGVASAI